MTSESMTDMLLAAGGSAATLKTLWFYVQIFIGFSVIIFVHELGHFLVAKWAGVRVEQFAIGFFREVVGFTYGETRYSFNLLPLGGYVKMLGQEDFEVDTTGELQFKEDPRSFANKTVGKRMAIVSAGVIMNLILAGFLFMIVFLVGMQKPAPIVGFVLPDSPASYAGLQTGDVVKEINDTNIDEFMDITMAVKLAKPGEPLDFRILRDGEEKHVLVEPDFVPDIELLQIGIGAPSSPVIGGIGPDYSLDNPKDPHPGDKIVRIGGPNVESIEITQDNANVLLELLLTDPLSYTDVTVERPIAEVGSAVNAATDSDDEVPTEQVQVNLKPRLVLRRADFGDNPAHLLGMVPLRRVSAVRKGGRADIGGLREGDIIVRWGNIDYPTGKEITEHIRESAKINEHQPERDIRVRVMRGKGGETEQLVIRPKVKVVPILGKRKPPNIGAGFELFADELLRVSEIVPKASGLETPAAKAGLPEGALIRTVNGKEIMRWLELASELQAHAGEDVTLTYDTDDDIGLVTTMHVPESLRTKLGVGPIAEIVSIDGDEMVDVKRKDREIPVAVKNPLGLQEAMRRNVGKTVAVRYRPNPMKEAMTADVAVTPEMVYPWLGTVGYTVDLGPTGQTMLLKKSNPIDALAVGVRKTYYFVLQVYQVMERMIFSRSLGVENISGPVGIVKLGSQMAEKSWVDLFYFLAIISANLAVINFLPLPIVDGGLMVFLIIEKIKGSPISMRVQVATQVVGLILIASAFVFVTIQDLFR